MAEFPSTAELLGDLVHFQSHTKEGQVQVAQYIHDVAERFELGNSRIIQYPAGAASASEQPTPVNVVIDIDGANANPDEIILWHGHFDTVPPEDYRDFHRDPHQLIQDHEDRNVMKGKGSYDMLGGVVAYLRAARNLQIAAHRRIRILLTSKEEDQSQGTHAAIHPLYDLTRDANALISTEIPVGSTLQKRDRLYIGRTGRVGLELNVHGERMHSGRVRHDDWERLASTREARVKIGLRDIRFEEHPDDPMDLMPATICVPGGWGSDAVRSLSVPSGGGMHLDVMYSNPRYTASDIHHIVRMAIRGILGDDNFNLNLEQRVVPTFTKPFLNPVDSPFVKLSRQYASAASGRDVRLKAARGVADEGIIANAKNIPAVIFPPIGEGEHTKHERIDITTIDNPVVPFLQKMAGHDGSLTK